MANPFPRPRRRLSPDDAREIAAAALAYLAGDEERLGGFLALTGLDPGGIREAAREPGFLGAVLDHVTGDEALIVGAAEAAGVHPEDVARAGALLAPRPFEE